MPPSAGDLNARSALPLSMALRIATRPAACLYTACRRLHQSPCSADRAFSLRPDGAFVVILAPIAVKFGLGGLLVATLLAGMLQFIMAPPAWSTDRVHPLPRHHRLHPASPWSSPPFNSRTSSASPLKHMPEHYLERVHALFGALPTFRKPDLLIGLITLIGLLVLPKITKRIPRR